MPKAPEDIVVSLCLPNYAGPDPRTQEAIDALLIEWPNSVPWRLKLLNGQGSPVDATRNFLANSARLPVPASMGNPPQPWMSGAAADILLWSDADCALPSPRDYFSLVQALIDLAPEVGLIGVPLPLNRDDETYRVNMDLMPGARLVPGGVVEVKKIGFGVVAHLAEPMDRMPWPWFSFRYGERPMTWGVFPEMFGEDYRFCEALRAQGYKTCAWFGAPGTHYIRRGCRLVIGDDGRVEVQQ